MPRDFTPKDEDGASRPKFSQDGPRRSKFSQNGGNRSKFGTDGARRPKQSLSEEIIKLDEDIIRLLARRASLMQKLRKGKAHAATPAVIKSEKQIRAAWEAQASKISRNPRLIRQLFGLLQDLDIQTQNPEHAYTPFNLAPTRAPVNAVLPAPASSLYSRLWLALAAAAGKSILLRGAGRPAAFVDCVKAFAQCGVSCEWRQNAQGREDWELVDGTLPNYHDKSIFVGDDPLTFYLLAFLGAARPGKMRFTGGVNMKDGDFSALARFMPSLGARLAWVVPGSKGLPAVLECSGQLPPRVEVPADLPAPAVLALLLAALTWPVKVSLALPALAPDEFKGISALLRPFFQACSAQVRLVGQTAEYAGLRVQDLTLPPEVDYTLDADLCAPLLSLPLFAGGSVKLTGSLFEKDEFEGLTGILKAFSLDVKIDNTGIACAAKPGAAWPKALECQELPVALHPLFWLFNARIAHKDKTTVRITRYPAGADLDLAEEFLAQAGFNMAADAEGISISPMSLEEFQTSASKTYGWSSPGPMWALALSLAAYMRANLKLSNPDIVSAVLPYYWSVYNGLPTPKISSASVVAEEEAPQRRRIRTNSVIEPELPLDEDAGADEE